MPRIAKQLTVQECKSLKPKPGKSAMFADGGKLYMHVSATGARSWIFRYEIKGRRRERGIGSFPDVSLLEARDKAHELRKGLRDGVDPIEAKRKEREAERLAAASVVTFGSVAMSYIEAHKAEWTSSTLDAWRGTLRNHVLPRLGKVAIADIDTDRVLDVLNPLWEKNPKTAATIRSRIELVLGLAGAKGLRQGDNPARWEAHLEFHLASPSKAGPKTRNFEAIPVAELPCFVRNLRKIGGQKSAVAEFAILTCTRIGEALGATWQEIDFPSRVWAVPAERMKTRVEHRIPLSDAALAILQRMQRRNDTDLIFVSDKGRLMHRSQINEVITKLHPGITAHGFRSTFRDWAAEGGKDRDLAEMALGHAVGSHVERSYRRTDLIEKRRELATAWSEFCG
jgi:integrase